MKTCFKCGQTKSLDEFYYHPATADRHLDSKTIAAGAGSTEVFPALVHCRCAVDQLDLFTNQRAGEYLVPPEAKPVKCGSCGAWMVWTKTEGGKAIPLSLATAETRDGQRCALTHFADCPESRQWRKK